MVFNVISVSQSQSKSKAMTDGNKTSILNGASDKVDAQITGNAKKPIEKNGTNKSKSDSELLTSVHNQDPLTGPNYFASYDALRDLCTNNVEYFRGDDSEAGLRFLNAYVGMLDHIEVARGYVDQIRMFAHEYDFSADTPGNGYRSFLLVVRSCVSHSLKLSAHVMQKRGSLLFRKSLYMK